MRPTKKLQPIKQIKLFYLPALFAVLVVLVMASTSWAATYHVDATNGNDSDDGLSEVTSWKTIAKVNSSNFQPGDFILFKRGEIWREQLVVPSSGSVGKPITFSSYGNGGNPIISGANVVTTWGQYLATEIYSAACIWTTAQVYEDSTRLTYVTWDTDIATTAASMNAGTWTLDDDNDLLYVWATNDANPDTHTMRISRRDYGVRLVDKSYVSVTGITAQYCNYAGMGFSTFAGTMDNNIVDSCGLNHNYQFGFFEHGGTYDHETNVKNCTAHDNGDVGIASLGHSNGSVIEGNTVYDNGINVEFDTGGGIKVLNVTAQNVVIQDNIVYTNGTRMAETIGAGIHLDTVGSGCIVRRNSSYNNNRFGIIVEHSDGSEIYYNLCYDNSNKAGITITRSCDDNVVYNNVCYSNDVGILIRGTIPSSPANDMTGNIVKNNICSGNTAREFAATYGGENDGTYGSGNVYEYNCFGPESSNFIEWGFGVYKSTYDDWETANGATTNSIEVDPLMTAPENAAFTLTSTSPCIDAGVDVGLTQDYRGKPIPTGHGVNIGAFEYQYLSAPKNIRKFNFVIYTFLTHCFYHK